MEKVLVSAPYMIKDRANAEKLFDGKGLSIVFADVRERLEETELLAIIGGYDAIICGDDRITKKVLDAAGRLRVIVKWGTGIDSIDRVEAERRGIPVFRTPDAFTDPVADTTVGLILAFARGLFVNDRVIKSGGWDKPQGYSLSERTVGIIGFGCIGSAAAKRLAVFGARILANDTAAKGQAAAKALGAELAAKEKIYDEADFITLHCDLNETSRRLLDRGAFSRMKRRPYVINTARGPVIEEAALIDALVSGRISGAGLDVFEYEPLPADSPLRKMDNVILAAHNSNSSPLCWQRVHENSIKMLLRGLGRE